MRYSFINAREENGKHILKFKKYFLFIPVGTVELIETNHTYKYGASENVWLYYPSFKIPGSASKITKKCNETYRWLNHFIDLKQKVKQ